MLSQKLGLTWLLPERVTSRLLATSRWVSPTSAGKGAVDVDIDLRIVEHLLDAQIGDAGHLADALQEIGGIGVVGLLVVADDLHVDRRRQAEIEDLRDDVGRQEREGRSREFLRQYGAQRLDEVGGRTVIFLQADQGVAVLRADRAGVLIGHVDAAERQADIVDDVVELVGRNGRADGLLDLIEQAGGLFDARARLGAHMHQDLAGIDRREEVLAEERRRARTTARRRPETGDERSSGGASASDQQRAVAVADALEASLEALLEAL